MPGASHWCTDNSPNADQGRPSRCRVGSLLVLHFAQGSVFISSCTMGAYGFVFSDFGKAFSVRDLNGEAPASRIITDVSDATPFCSCERSCITVSLCSSRNRVYFFCETVYILFCDMILTSDYGWYYIWYDKRVLSLFLHYCIIPE